MSDFIAFRGGVDFAELAEVPWHQTWWVQVLRFMHRQSACVPTVRIDSVPNFEAELQGPSWHDRLCNPGCCSWPGEVQKQYASLRMASPFPDDGSHQLTSMLLALRKAM